MKLKKWMSVILAATMILSLAACSGSKAQEEAPAAETKAAETKAAETRAAETKAAETEAAASEGISFPLAESMNFSCLTIMPNTVSINDNVAWKYLLEQANLTMDVTELSVDEYVEKANLLMNSGDYPEFLFKASKLDLNKYGMEGLLIPLEDLIREYAPNLTALLDERNGWNVITAADGHVYALPCIVPSRIFADGNFVWWINKRWLDNLGLEEPTNADELYEVLKAFKEQDANGNGDPNDEVPMTFDGDWGLVRYQSYLGDGSHYQDYFYIKDGELDFYPMTEGFKNDYLGFFKKLADEGILKASDFSQTADQVKALGMSGDILGMFQNSSASGYVENYNDYVPMKAYAPDLFPLNTGVTPGAMSITDKCENPEVLIAWADQLFTEEGGCIPRMGVEGDTYTVNADGTWLANNEKYDNYTYQCTLMGAAAVPFLQPELYLNAADQDTRDLNKWLYDPEVGIFGKGTIVPTLTFTEEENEIVSTLKTSINDYIKVYTAKVVSGEADLEGSWDEFQNTLKNMGAEDLVKVYKDAYARAK